MTNKKELNLEQMEQVNGGHIIDDLRRMFDDLKKELDEKISKNR